jgi:2-dehydro-3-deoxygluconokinase
MPRIVTFGETMVQYNAAYTGLFDEHGTHTPDCAGAESNVAVNLTKLGLADIATVWVSRLGDDEEGDFVLAELTGRTHVVAEKKAGERTGISYLNHLEDGQHVKSYRRKGSAASRLEPRDVEPHIPGADLLHVTGITPALSDTCRETVMAALTHARDHGVAVSFDANYRPQLWSPAEARPLFEAMVGHSSLFKVGYDEAKVVWGEAWSPVRYAKYFQEANGGLAVVTLGAGGAMAFDGNSLVSRPGYAVEVVDPIGAGDAFMAGFLGSLMAHTTMKDLLNLDAGSRSHLLGDSLEIANVCGALTCTRRGDTAAMPTIQEVRQFIETWEPTVGRRAP